MSSWRTRMDFIITCVLQSFWRHDPHPINNMRGDTLWSHRSHQVIGHHILTGNSSAPKSKGSVKKFFKRFKHTQLIEGVPCSNALFSANVYLFFNWYFTNVSIGFLIFLYFFQFQSDTRRYQNNNDVGLEYTVTDTQGIVFCLSTDQVKREAPTLFYIFILYFQDIF